ncbi:InlB B-repeat-containing protein [Eisenbergiella sp.]
MAQVSNESELSAALAGTDPSIQLTADIPVTKQLEVGRDVTISSLFPDVFALTKAAAYSQNLFRVASGASLHLNSIILDGDMSSHPASDDTNRSLIHVNGGSLYLGDGCILRNNYSASEGGGVCLQASPPLDNLLVMNGSARITGCVSKTSGGAIAMFPASSHDRAELSGQAVIADNSAANGGGICCHSLISAAGISLTIGGEVRITGNSASSSGGGIYFSGCRGGGAASSLLKLTGSMVLAENSACHGGGIYFHSANAGDRLEISTTAPISANRASNNGGAVCLTAVSQPASVHVEDTIFRENTAGTGGMLYLLSDAGFSLTAQNSSLVKNTATSGASGSGGGLWLQNRSLTHPSEIRLQGCLLEGNQASASGGAIALYGGLSSCSFTAEGSSFLSNRSSGSGGALLLGSEAETFFSLDVCRFADNEAGNSGGAIYYSSGGTGTVRFTGCRLSSNTAGYEGGALRLFCAGKTLDTSVENSIFSGNTAINHSGGAIWNGGSGASLLLTDASSVTDNTCRIGNGGGIYCSTANGTLTLQDNVTVQNNRAGTVESDFGGHGGGICCVPGRLLIRPGTDISGNSALQSGGGVSLSEGSMLDMTGGSIRSNTARRQGGGLWNHGGSTAILTGGDIFLNQAGVGGGIYNAIGSQIYKLNQASLGKGGENRASSYAPGIYNNGEFYIEGLRDITNGFYIEDRDAVVFLQGNLDSGSIIQLDNSGYVSPNPEGAPVIAGEGTPPHTTLTQQDADAFRKPPQDFDGWEIRLNGNQTQIWLIPIVYAICYENLEGSLHTNPGSYTAVTPDIRLLPPQERPGYRFAGWYHTPEGGRQITVIPQGSTGDITLFARWVRRRPHVPHRANRICKPGNL